MRVGFIGLGKQGRPIAANLVRARYSVVVHDRRPEPVAEICKSGAVVAGSPREVAARSKIVQICVVDDRQLKAVFEGEEGLLAGLTRGCVIAIHSTVSPQTVIELAAEVAERGATLLDAPVSGGERGAVRGTLSYMVGGDAEALERCRPLFETSGANITHCGGVGMGMRAKLAHQIVIAINRLAAFEGMSVGLKAGLSKEVLHKIIHEGGAQSRVADNWFTQSSREFALPLYHKDIQLGLAMAHGLGIRVPGAALAQQYLDDIIP